MSEFGELYLVNHEQVLKFFLTGLRDVSKSAPNEIELWYNASMLAHYAQVSTAPGSGTPAPASLITVFDHFVLNSSMINDKGMMETAASQCLLLTGFFGNRMRKRYNINWYSQLGSYFFHRAARLEDSAKHARLLSAMAEQFKPWRNRHARLSRKLRDFPYLLKPS